MIEHPYTNRLINEKSPHLLHHAHNPVDWFPWGEDAFEAARKQEKPIFLSIGYATCHWCHMMEKQCFNNIEIANLINESFVCIKVDREELPEVDAIYMDFAQTMMAGVVGWPLNVVLTPDLKPFYAMTYFPEDGSLGPLGMGQMILNIKAMWDGEERQNVSLQAERIVETFENSQFAQGAEMPDSLHSVNTAELLFRLADPIYGGIKGMPKFPVVCQICFMLRYVFETRDARALFYADKSMEMMQRGGIHDHLGGGFARYTSDERWMVPHFEKMLYDNALIVRATLEMWQLTKKPHYRKLSEDVISYLISNLEHKNGGFYSAEDADLEGKEGYYYTWTYEEVANILGFDNCTLFCEYYDITRDGNFEGRNVINAPYSLEEYAELKEMEEDELALHFETQRRILLEARKKRSKPFRDEKIISSWNGLTINALAESARILQDNRSLEAAKKAARFVKSHLWVDGRFLRRWCDGEARFDATLEDYAFMIQGLLTLFEVDGDAGWLAWAMQLTAVLENSFKEHEGAFFSTDGSDSSLLINRCEFVDGAIPSGNAAHCENLLRLYQFTGELRYLEHAEDILRAAKEYLDGFNPSYCYHLIVLQWYLSEKTVEIVIALNQDDEHKVEIQCALAEHFIPYKVVIWRREDDEHLFELLPFVRNQRSRDGKTTVYICQGGQGALPMTNLSEILAKFKEL
ncbi:MAG: hypothetical protein ACI9S8_001143 [Chlamydiales bacterium]|jgi:uncharacterized protein YyaL (SSP411 family)